MTCSAPDLAFLADRAERLAGRPVRACHPAAEGGNSRLFRVEMRAGDSLALKLYPPMDEDGRDRLGTESASLAFMARHDVAARPGLVGVDKANRLALLEWLEGQAVRPVVDGDVEQALAFLSELHRLRHVAGELPPASEACLSEAELFRQLRDRLGRLRRCRDPDLQTFLDVLAGRVPDRLGDAVPLAPASRTLSPSDFGFHNALRRPDGRLVFVDFEYFGWDDPVKLTADILLHPGMSMSLGQRRLFMAGLDRLHGDAPDYAARLERLLPHYVTRWCLIMLNPFLPGRSRDPEQPRRRLQAARELLEGSYQILTMARRH